MFIKKDRWYATVGPFLRCLVVVGEDDGQHPLEILRGVHRMGLFGGHHQRLAGLYQVGHTVYGELTHTLQHGNHSVAGGIVGADLLTGCKGKQGHHLKIKPAGRSRRVVWVWQVISAFLPRR